MPVIRTKGIPGGIGVGRLGSRVLVGGGGVSVGVSVGVGEIAAAAAVSVAALTAVKSAARVCATAVCVATRSSAAACELPPPPHSWPVIKPALAARQTTIRAVMAQPPATHHLRRCGGGATVPLTLAAP